MMQSGTLSTPSIVREGIKMNKLIPGLAGLGIFVLGAAAGAIGLAAFARQYVEKRYNDDHEFPDTEETQDTIQHDWDKTDHASQAEELQVDESFDERFERFIDDLNGSSDHPEIEKLNSTSEDEESLEDTLKYLSESDDSPDIPEV